MNDIIQNLEANATNGKENFCYISEKQLNAMKKLSKREAKENKQIKEIYKELFNTYQKLKKENEEVTLLNLHQVDKIQQLKEEIEEYKNPIKYFKYASKNVTEENKQLKDKLSKIETLIINHNCDTGDIYYKYNSKFLKSELKQRILEIVYKEGTDSNE